MAYQVVGDGPFDLVFVPGWTSNVDVMWEEPSLARFLHTLASFSRLLCFDKRGTGVSDPVPLAAPPTLEQWMDDIRAVMDAVGSERAALFGQLAWAAGKCRCCSRRRTRNGLPRLCFLIPLPEWFPMSITRTALHPNRGSCNSARRSGAPSTMLIG